MFRSPCGATVPRCSRASSKLLHRAVPNPGVIFGCLFHPQIVGKQKSWHGYIIPNIKKQTNIKNCVIQKCFVKKTKVCQTNASTCLNKIYRTGLVFSVLSVEALPTITEKTWPCSISSGNKDRRVESITASGLPKESGMSHIQQDPIGAECSMINRDG